MKVVLDGEPHGRDCTKLQYNSWTGPWRVLDRGEDAALPRVQCMHTANKRVETFNIAELKAFYHSLMSSLEGFEKTAQRDAWEYSVDRILDHRPRGPRKRKAKNSYCFEVLYIFLNRSTESGQENPAWQPYSAVAHTEELQQYCDCARDDISAELGTNFFVANE
jgi:hypothetical protein